VRPFPEVWGERLRHWRQRTDRRRFLLPDIDPVKSTAIAILAFLPLIIWFAMQVQYSVIPLAGVCGMVLAVAWAYKRYPSDEESRDVILYSSFVALTLLILLFIFLSTAYGPG
jgi:hypothetical protein